MTEPVYRTIKDRLANQWSVIDHRKIIMRDATIPAGSEDFTYDSSLFVAIGCPVKVSALIASQIITLIVLNSSCRSTLAL